MIFVTNNSTKSRNTYLEKFKKLGIESVGEDDIFSSSYAAAYYLKNVVKFPRENKVYVVGMKGITQELEIAGIDWIGSELESKCVTDGTPEWESYELDKAVGAVVIGFDLYFNYVKLCNAHTYLRYQKDCLFIATNTDALLPTGSRSYPGTGTMVAALKTAAGRDPLVMGKPEKLMLRCIMEKFQIDPERTLMVGDRLDTDIQFGKNGGLKTLLVMTGITKPTDLQSSSIKPDFWIDSLADFQGKMK